MPDDFEHFDEGVRGKGDQDRLEPIEGGERLRLEHVMEERRIDDRDLKSHGCEYGEDELRVREQTDLPDGLARRSHGEDEEQFEEHDGREGDGPGSDGIGPFLQFEEEHAERADRQDRRDDEDQEKDVPREHALPRIARRPVHDVRRVRVHAERESRQSVRHEVDPEKLHRREERKEPGVSDGEGRDEHDEDLARVRGKEEGDELPDVLVDPPAFLHRRDDGREVVVGEDHVCALLGHVGPRDPHRDAQIGSLQGGCVVHTVAGHGDDVTRLLPGVHDAHLVFRGDPRIDPDAFHLTCEVRVGHLLKLFPGEGEVAFAEDPHLPGHGHRRSLWSPVIMTTRIRAFLQRRIASIASERGASIIPARPRNVRSASSVSSFRGGNSPWNSRTARPITRNARVANSWFRNWYWLRSYSDKGLRSPSTMWWEQLARIRSGAPFTWRIAGTPARRRSLSPSGKERTVRPSDSGNCAWRVDIFFRSEVKAISATRGHLARMAAGSMPARRAATRSAPSVGSPSTIHRVPSCRSTASLHRTPHSRSCCNPG